MLNPKKYKHGEVVYFVNRGPLQYDGLNYDSSPRVCWGTMLEDYPSTLCIQLYDTVDNRLINGISVRQFETPTRWQKLPENWSWDTKLFNVTYDWKPFYNCKTDNPENISKAISDGVFVEVQDKDYCTFYAEIDKDKGYRIIRNYTPFSHHPTYLCINWKNVYSTYEEAQCAVDKENAEFKRQSELSDYDWSVEQIDHELNRWAAMYKISDDIKQKYRDWILALDRVEDVEVRIIQGNIQWKYWMQKKWKNIDL